MWCLLKDKNSKLIQDPAGQIHAVSTKDLAFYATSIFSDIQTSQGDVKNWWKINKPLYEGINKNSEHIQLKEGAPHFWRRVNIKTTLEIEGIEIFDFQNDDLLFNLASELAVVYLF